MSEWTIERYGDYSTARIVCDGRPVSKRMSAEHASTIAKNHNALCSNPTPALTLARDALVDAERLLREVAEAEVVRLVRGGLFTPEEASENAKPMFDKLDGYKKIISAINAELKE